jgi:hypothetical protein
MTPYEQEMMRRAQRAQADSVIQNFINPPLPPEPEPREDELRGADPFSLRQSLWQNVSRRGGQQMADRLVGRPYFAEDRPFAIGDFLGGGVVDMVDAGTRYASGQEMTGNDAMAAGFGLLETIPAAMFAGRAMRGPRGVGESAADTYRVGQRLAPPAGYVAPAGRPSTVRLPGDQQFEARPISEIERATAEYLNSRGMDASPMAQYAPFSEDRARMIAAAYDMMPHDPGNPAVRRAYDAMIQETLDQYNALRNSGIDFRFLREGMSDPYAASPALGYQDLVENGRLWVFPTDFGFGTSAAFDPSTNPLLTRVGRIGDKPDAVANDAFRAVHDAFGHFGPGNPFFRHQGEERAFLEHSRMYSPEARGAMTSETRGQNSWLNFGPFGEQNRTALGADTVFADQKTGLMPSWTSMPTGMPDPDEERMLRGLLDQWRTR